MHNPDFRQRAAHFSAFGRIVVKESQGIESDSELGGNFTDVCGFLEPVNAGGGKMLGLQLHSRMTIEHLPRIIRIILAANGEQNTAMMKIQYSSLKVVICGAR